MTARLLACTLPLLVAAACDEPAPAEVHPAPPGAVASTPTVSAAVAASASAAPAPPPVAAPAPTAWAGHYEAKVGEVSPPTSAREKTWTKDPGTAAIGKGTLELTVAEKGVVHGSASGPLGELVVSGELDGEELRASLTPKEPNGEQAMTGVLTLEKKGTELEGTLRVSDRAAKIVREAAVQLSPK